MTSKDALKSDEVERNDPARKPSNVSPVFKPTTLEVKENLQAGGLIKMVKVPAGVTVFAFSLCVQRQGRETLRLNVGDDDDPKRYIAGGVVPKFGGRLDATGSGSICDYGEAATIDVTIAEGELQPGDMLRAVVGYASA